MEMVEIELEDRTLSISAETLRRVQAAWRGAVVRRQLSSVRNQYEQVIRETELPGFSLHLTWPAKLTSTPHFSKSTQPGLTVTTEEPKVIPTSNKKSVPNVGVFTNSEKCQSHDDLLTTELCTDVDNPAEKEIHVPIENVTPNLDVREAVANGNMAGQDRNLAVQTGDDTGGNTDALTNGGSELGLVRWQSDAQQQDQVTCATHHTTTVWDSVDVTRAPVATDTIEKVDRETLLNEQNTIAMELLWIQQAICSRKQYLHLRQEMSGGTS